MYETQSTPVCSTTDKTYEQKRVLTYLMTALDVQWESQD